MLLLISQGQDDGGLITQDLRAALLFRERGQRRRGSVFSVESRLAVGQHGLAQEQSATGFGREVFSGEECVDRVESLLLAGKAIEQVGNFEKVGDAAIGFLDPADGLQRGIEITEPAKQTATQAQDVVAVVCRGCRLRSG